MSLSQGDIDNFHHFASQELRICGSNQGMEDLLRKWQRQQEQEETLASIRRGLEDANAGRLQDISAVDERIRTELGFPARR